MRSQWILAIGLVGLIVCLSTSWNQCLAQTADDSVVVAEIGNTKITMKELNAKVAEIPPYARKNFLTREGKEKILDNLLKSEILYKAAIDAGYDKNPEIKAKVDDSVKRIYQSEYFKNEMKDKLNISDKDLQDYYNKHKEEFKVEQKIKVAHILVDTEADAKDIAAKLKAGEKFDELALKRSLDLSTNNTAGVIGFITPGGYIKGLGKSDEFEKAAFGLKNPGDLSEPVKTSKGWHIIKLLEKAEGEYKPFDEVQEEIGNKLMVSDEEVKKEYEANKDKYTTRARVKVKHIQVNTEEEANAVLKALKDGQSFDDLARDKSQDKSSSNKGGDIGYLYRDGYIRGIGKDKAFEDAAFNLAEGAFGGPIKTNKGFHVIKIEEKTPETQKPIEEVESQIRNKLLREGKEGAVEKQFEALQKKYSVKTYKDKITDSKEEDFGPVTEESAPPPPEY